MDEDRGAWIISEQEAQAICDQLALISPEFEWRPECRRADAQGSFGGATTWAAFGKHPTDWHTAWVMPTAKGSTARYRAELVMCGHPHEHGGRWDGYANDPIDAYRSGVAGFMGRWEDRAAHRAYCAELWRERVEDQECELEESRRWLADFDPALAPIEWEVSGDDGERVLTLSQAGYTARILEGRVWRWQAGDDVTPDIYAGRIVGSLEDAQRAAAAALVLLELGALSDLAPEHVHRHPGRST
jgi:hypothetical protein